MDRNSLLKGKTIIITRAKDKQSEAKKLFNRFGAHTIDLPALVIGPPDDWTPLDKALLEIQKFNWIIFSSSNGVNAVEERLNKIGKSLSDDFSNLKIAVVGRKTALTLKHIGVDPDFIPPDFVAEGLIEHFPDKKSNQRILIPRVQSGGRSVLAKFFLDVNAEILEVPAYESCCPEVIPESTLFALRSCKVDAITFTSGKTVKHTVQLLRKYFGEEYQTILESVKIVSIGPQTSITCNKYLNRVDKEASPYDLNGLLNACIDVLSRIQ